ncbi:MAG: 3-deoxy-D-manno-octulosonate 8-phosphate phosphatase (KDO 8-P phosphatase) [Bacteroidia bacterium]|jgi:3-deoxy-D-manno-octulosonate 8-phosphate phosphatase (KDO 8-P phosphatase)
MARQSVTYNLAEIYLQKLKKVKVFVFDIDGVLTDGNIYVSDAGVFTRSTSVKDGYALVKAIKSGYKIVVISGGSADGVKIRLNRLGIPDVFLRVKDKLAVLNTWLKENNFEISACLMMGDDEPDLPVLNAVGFSCCPADAVQKIKDTVDYQSPNAGGKGCVRNVIETRLKLTNDW